MRLKQLASILEQADPDKIYVIGDSHAVAIGSSISGANVLAKNGAKLSEIAAQAQAVPDGSRVVMTGGNNDIGLNHNAAGAEVTKIINSLKNRNCNIRYVSFPPIDLNGAYAEVYNNAGYTANYNRVQQSTARAAASALGASNVTGLTMADINPTDPMRIHAKPAAYQRIAQGVSSNFAAVSTDNSSTPGAQDNVELDQIQADISRVPPEDLPFVDRDGDGIVTMADAEEIGMPTSIFSAGGGGDFFGLFGILQDFMNRSKPIDPTSTAYKNWIAGERQRNPDLPQTVAARQRAGAGSSSNARTALAFFKGKGFTDEQAAGIVGNLQAESGPNINPAAIGDGGAAWGIAQWHPDRRAIWERANNKQWQSNGSQPNFNQQLEFIVYELQRTEANAMRRLQATRSAEAAAAVFDQYYERSSGAHRDRRIANAVALMGNQSTQTADASGVPVNGNPLFSLDGSQSRMTQDDAAEQMAQTLARYKAMSAKLPFQVRVNDAIAKNGTSRETQTPGSQHFHGTALDLSIAGLSQQQVKQLLVAAKSVGFTGFGFGSSILHVDSGPKRTWDYGNTDFAGMNLQSVKNWAVA